MQKEKSGLLTASNIAKELGISDAKAKKAIKELGIKPKAKRGVCNYYSQEELVKIKLTLKK